MFSTPEIRVDSEKSAEKNRSEVISHIAMT